MKSVDINVTEAMEKIEAMNSIDEISAFIEGDERKTVKATGKKRIRDLTESAGTKQGEQAVPITKTTSDFKEGIQKTKDYVTGEDVVKTLRAKGVKI